MCRRRFIIGTLNKDYIKLDYDNSHRGTERVARGNENCIENYKEKT